MGPPPPRSGLEWPWSWYAELERVAHRLGISSRDLDEMWEWQIAARLGYDLVDGTTGTQLSNRATVRAEHSKRAAELSMLPEDVRKARAERAKNRKARRQAQKADPEWRRQVKAAKDPNAGIERQDTSRLAGAADITIVAAPHG